MDIDKGVDVWYKFEDRSVTRLAGFTGNFVDDILTGVMKKSKLDNAPDTLQAFVKKPGSDEEKSLHLLENEKDEFIFPNLISEYKIGRKNPVIIRISASPKKIILADDEIEETLTKIINSLNHQPHMIEMEKVEEFQKRRLGRFYKKLLPPGTTATTLYLPMLGQVLPDMEPTTSGEAGKKKRTFSEIVQSDTTKTRGHHIVAMVARSGSGKTATVIHLAKKHFVIYAICESVNTYTPDFSDSNFRILSEDVEKMCSTLPKPVPNDDMQEYVADLINYDYQLKNLARERVQLEFLARQLFLELLFRNNPQVTPEAFFLEQLSDGSATIRQLVNKLRIYDPVTIRSMLGYVEDHLKTFLTGRGLVIALDEAHIAETDCLRDRLISPSAISNNNNFLDRNGMICLDLRRGFLTPLCAALSDMRATLVVLGTRLTLMDPSHVYSAIAKSNIRFVKITSFPSCDESHVEELLGQLIDISDCVIRPEKKRLLSGRCRFVTSVAAQISNEEHSDKSKQEIMNKAIKTVISKAKEDIQTKVKTLLKSDKAVMIKHLFSRIVIAFKLKGGKIAFTQQDEFDFVNSGVCALREDSDGYYWVVEEPLVIEVLEAELRASGFDPNILTYLDQLNMMLINLGINSAAKGEAFELLVYRALQRFNGTVLADLPFVKNIENLPEWCKSIILKVRIFGTAQELGYGNDSASGDVKFFEKTPGKELLIPNNVTRPDGALLFEDKKYGLSLAIKLYSQAVDKEKHKLNKGSSNLRDCFLTKDNKVNTRVKNQRRQFTKTAFYKLKGILRIHLEFPRVSGGTPKSCVNGQDILVYIDDANMNTFFDESIAEYSQDMKILKKMLKHIWEEGMK